MDRNKFLERFVKNLHTLGIRPNGVLLVHSSLKSLGQVPGGPETIIQGLLKSLGKNGTLLMPALSYETVRSNNPVFDVRSTPSCVGAVPEFFRTRPGTQRSLHPTHSVCGVGPLTEELLIPHAQDSTPCGSNSPFHRLPEFGGQILMLGCGLRPNTSMHAIEELVEPLYLFGPPICYTLTDQNGITIQKEYIRHNFCDWQQRYDRIAEVLESPYLRTGKVMKAQAHMIEASALWAEVLAKLKSDPLFFVDEFTP